jgi:tryptophan-rich sensory protein
MRSNHKLALPAFVLLCHLAGLVGAATTDTALYREIMRPTWAPPGWVFGPVWITLYTMMGVATWLVWRTGPSPDRRRAMTSFAVQLALNAAWTPVFFGLRSIGGGLLVIAVLNVAILATIVTFGRRSQLAAWLLVPYAAWVGFATALTTELWRIN